jgi:MotA/TolQ/ExbB proton channel family
MRRLLIRYVLPFLFCLAPILAAAVVLIAIPPAAKDSFLRYFKVMDVLILAIGIVLFALQMMLAWKALRYRTTGFDEGADRWIMHLAQAAEWFPMLGLLGTVGGILETFGSVKASVTPAEIIRSYAPAITATGCGLYMAFINILPSWIVITGRDLITQVGGGPTAPVATEGAGDQP